LDVANYFFEVYIPIYDISPRRAPSFHLHPRLRLEQKQKIRSILGWIRCLRPLHRTGTTSRSLQDGAQSTRRSHERSLHVAFRNVVCCFCCLWPRTWRFLKLGEFFRSSLSRMKLMCFLSLSFNSDTRYGRTRLMNWKFPISVLLPTSWCLHRCL
jgi:hypothetical protein